MAYTITVKATGGLHLGDEALSDIRVTLSDIFGATSLVKYFPLDDFFAVSVDVDEFSFEDVEETANEMEEISSRFENVDCKQISITWE